MRIVSALALGAALAASSAFADATTIKTYIAGQLPNNNTGQITPLNVRNSFNYLTDNLSTVPYTGQIVTSYTISGTIVRASDKFIGDVSATNVSATHVRGTFVGDGSGLTNLPNPSWYDVTDIPTAVADVSNGTVVSTSLGYFGIVSATTLYGDGSNLTGIALAGNVPWVSITSVPAGVANVSNSTGSVTATTFTGTNLGGTLTTAAQPNVTSLGTLTSLAVSGHTSLASVSASSNVSVTGNVSAAKFIGDGSLLTGISAGSTSPSWYAVQNIPTQVQAVSNSGSITMTEVSATRLYAQYISGSNIEGKLTTAAQPNITSLGTLTGLTVNGTTSSTNLYAQSVSGSTGTFGAITTGSCTGCVSSLAWTSLTGVPAGVANVSNSTGSVTATTFTGTNLGGTLTTTTQNNIQTMTGLTTVSVTGNISVSTINGQVPVFGGGSSISTTTFTAASNISGSTAIGFGAAAGTGTGNTIYGVNAGRALTSSNSNTLIGANAGISVTSIGSRNTAVGSQSLGGDPTTPHGGLTGNHNVAVGEGAAGFINGNANRNTSMGGNRSAGWFNTGSDNSVFGAGTGTSSCCTGTSSRNSIVGSGAAPNPSSDDNVIIGYGSGPNIFTGGSNTIVGTLSGVGLSSGFKNIILGVSLTTPANSTSNYLNVGGVIFGTAYSSNPFIGIGISSPTVNLEVSGTVSATRFVGDGNGLTNLPSSPSPSWYAIQSIPVGVQNVSNSTGSVTATTFTGTNLGGTLTTAAQPNVTSVGTLTGLTVSGVGTFGTVTATAVNGLNISGTSITGKIITASQPSITTVGTLSSLNVTGTVTATAFSGDGSLLTGITAGIPDVIIEDQRVSGTVGGTATTNAWTTRTLNTLVRNNGSTASLSTNQVTLPAGTYYFESNSMQFYNASTGFLVQERIFNVTDSTEATHSINANGANFPCVYPITSGVVTISGSKAFSLQYYRTQTNGTTDLGNPMGIGTERYARVNIWKVK